jgi:hypothetical protein
MSVDSRVADPQSIFTDPDPRFPKKFSYGCGCQWSKCRILYLSETVKVIFFTSEKNSIFFTFIKPFFSQYFVAVKEIRVQI